MMTKLYVGWRNNVEINYEQMKVDFEFFGRIKQFKVHVHFALIEFETAASANAAV